MTTKKGFKIYAVNYRGLLAAFVDNIKKVLWIIARDAFLFILICILLAVVFGEFLFYNYVILAEVRTSDQEASLTTFKEDTYQSVIKELQVREDAFNGPTNINYQNPFY